MKDNDTCFVTDNIQCKEFEFKIGDIVRLKSGGPDMTIAQLPNWNSDYSYSCKWFDDYKNLGSEMFKEGTLESVYIYYKTSKES